MATITLLSPVAGPTLAIERVPDPSSPRNSWATGSQVDPSSRACSPPATARWPSSIPPATR
jgi:hypothetical protein